MTESVMGTLRRVVGQRRETAADASPYPVNQYEKPVDKPLFDYFFKLQNAVEKEGAMDYRRYASRMWQDLVVADGETGSNLEQDPQFRRFESNLILGLQDIDMRKHTYKEFVESLGRLVTKYSETIRKVVVWSTGDEMATGYQPAKIARSGIISDFLMAARARLTDKSISAKTGYIVSDDKFKKLGDYLASEAELNKLVVIEDSRGNLKKVGLMVDQLNEARLEGKKVEYIPIWAAYSREGIQAKERAEREGKLEEFGTEKERLNAIDSPRDLSEDRFGQAFQEADILVDFDGVISNNLTMREVQAHVKHNALIGAIMEKQGVTIEQANKSLLDNLAKTTVGT